MVWSYWFTQSNRPKYVFVWHIYVIEIIRKKKCDFKCVFETIHEPWNITTFLFCNNRVRLVGLHAKSKYETELRALSSFWFYYAAADKPQKTIGRCVTYKMYAFTCCVPAVTHFNACGPHSSINLSIKISFHSCAADRTGIIENRRTTKNEQLLLHLSFNRTETVFFSRWQKPQQQLQSNIKFWAVRKLACFDNGQRIERLL